MEVSKGYQLTEFGEIPIDWLSKKFEDVLTGFSSGQTPSRTRPEYYRGSIRWITSGELNYNVITDTKEKITEAAVRNTSLKIIPKGTFLFAITGLEAEGTRGSCGIVGEEAATNQSCMALYASKEITTEYFFHFYVHFGNWLALKFCQGTKQQSYTGKTARVLPIILPPTKEEQTAIAQALSDTDSLITALDKLIAKKSAVKQGAMQLLLTGKKRLPGFDGEWKETSLRAVADTLKGNGLSKSKVKNGGVAACLLYGELFTTYGRTIKKVISYTDSNEGTISKKGDVLMPGSTTTTGVDLAIASALLLSGVRLGGDVLIIRKKKSSYDSEFLANYLTYTKKKEITERTQGITIIHLYGKDLWDLELILPPVEEQEAIAQVITDMDNEIAGLQEKLEKYKSIKAGMMQQLLTGKIRLV